MFVRNCNDATTRPKYTSIRRFLLNFKPIIGICSVMKSIDFVLIFTAPLLVWPYWIQYNVRWLCVLFSLYLSESILATIRMKFYILFKETSALNSLPLYNITFSIFMLLFSFPVFSKYLQFPRKNWRKWDIN